MSLLIDERRFNFKETIQKVIGSNITRNDANDFYRYWAAEIQGTEIMLFEDQKTWNLNMRIATWIKNKTKFGHEAESRKNKNLDKVEGKRIKGVNSIKDITETIKKTQS